MPPTQGAQLTQAECSSVLLVLQEGSAFLDTAAGSEHDAFHSGQMRAQAAAASSLRTTLVVRIVGGTTHLDADGYDELLTMLFNLAVGLEVALDRERTAAVAAQLSRAVLSTKRLRNGLILAHGGGPRAFGPI